MADGPGLRQIRSIHLKDEAYDALHAAITNLDLAPGQAISESMLVEQLGVSKTPIRAALSRLEAEGMVETVPFKGTFVSVVEPQDARDVIEFRIILEVAAVRMACERASAEDLDALMELGKVASIDEAAGQHQLALHDIGLFHDQLVRLSGNRRLEAAFSSLRGALMRIRALSGAMPDSIVESSAEHMHIVEAIAGRDAELAADLLSTHLSRVLDLYLASTEPSDAPSGP